MSAIARQGATAAVVHFIKLIERQNLVPHELEGRNAGSIVMPWMPS
jgi:hypothetical protein